MIVVHRLRKVVILLLVDAPAPVKRARHLDPRRIALDLLIHQPRRLCVVVQPVVHPRRSPVCRRRVRAIRKHLHQKRIVIRRLLRIMLQQVHIPARVQCLLQPPARRKPLHHLRNQRIVRHLIVLVPRQLRLHIHLQRGAVIGRIRKLLHISPADVLQLHIARRRIDQQRIVIGLAQPRAVTFDRVILSPASAYRFALNS